MRRWIRAAALSAALVTGEPGLAQPQQSSPFAQRIEALLAGVQLPGARIGVVIMEAATGRVLYQHDPDVPLNPASNAKVLTAAAALSLLGPAHRYSTGLYSGTITPEGVAHSIVLKGFGDPSLRTADLFDLARQASLAGLRRVEGDVVVDDTWFGSEHLPPAFEQQPREGAPFRAAVGAVSVDENALALHVRPGARAGLPALTTLFPPGYAEVENRLMTGVTANPSVIFDVSALPDGRARATITGTFPSGALAGATYYRRLDDPGRAAGCALRYALEASGVTVTGRVRLSSAGLSGMTRLARHESLPLSALLYEVGKDSNNFTAEMTLLAIAAQREEAIAAPEPTTFARGASRMLAWARRAGVNTEGMIVRNGSGLFDANRISARQVTQVLRAAWRDPAIRDEYVSQFAVGGDDGTLRNRLQIAGVSRVVRAKTGTLDDAIALSGYVLAPDPSDTLIFSILSNGVRGHARVARVLADRIVVQSVEHAMPNLVQSTPVPTPPRP